MNRHRMKMVYDTVESLGLEISVKTDAKKILVAEKKQRLTRAQLTDHVSADDVDDDDMMSREDIDHEEDDVLEASEVTPVVPIKVVAVEQEKLEDEPPAPVPLLQKQKKLKKQKTDEISD